MEQKIQDEVLNVENQTVEQPENPVLSPKAMRELTQKMKLGMKIVSITYYILAGIHAALTLFSIGNLIIDDHNPFTEKHNPVFLILLLGIAALEFFLATYLRDAIRACKKFSKAPHEVKHLESIIEFQAGYWNLLAIFLLTIIGILLLALFLFVVIG
ncbi:MAG: hypothetical protein LBB85_02760 [Dysgonamonadaceae bacterium]|jgi:hypothetical protein|nr:hypothetical protein [Dysgonamonadaceae bacterium]